MRRFLLIGISVAAVVVIIVAMLPSELGDTDQNQDALTFAAPDSLPGAAQPTESTKPASQLGKTKSIDVPNDSVFSAMQTDLSDAQRAWISEYVTENPKGVHYDRIRLVDINIEKLLVPIKASPDVQSAMTGERYVGPHNMDFTVEPFADRVYRLVIRRAEVHEINGKQITAITGIAYDKNHKPGTFTMAINEDTRDVLGEIDAPNEWIRFWPGPNRAFHVIAELSQDHRRQQQQKESY